MSTLSIEYCPACGWLLRSAYFAQEFLTTFHGHLSKVSLIPSETNGAFKIYINDEMVFDRKVHGGFPEIKILKQIVRDKIAPGKSLGHTDSPSAK